MRRVLRRKAVLATVLLVSGGAWALTKTAPLRTPATAPLASPVTPALQAPAEIIPTLRSLGLTAGDAAPLTASQEQALLRAETYCARFGEYPETMNRAAPLEYRKNGLEMELKSPSGTYTSVDGWEGLSGSTPVEIREDVHIALDRAALQNWLRTQWNWTAPLGTQLQGIELDYSPKSGQGSLRLAGVQARIAADQALPVEACKALPATAQRAMLRPELVQAVLGKDSLGRLGCSWTRLLQSHSGQWVGIGSSDALDLTGLRGQMSLWKDGRLSAFLMLKPSCPLVSSSLQIASNTMGWTQLALGGLSSYDYKGQAPSADASTVGLGSFVLDREKLEVHWRAQAQSNQVVIEFITNPAEVKEEKVAESGPDLNTLHKTRSSVMAGR